MIDRSSYLLYVATCVALILVPGPAQALVLARTMAGGRRAGALTAIGLNVGTLCHTVAAALGLSAILATSALAFSVVKLAGAAYLIVLGIRSLIQEDASPAVTRVAASAAKPNAAFGQAVVTGILNPKVALFFLAFLPQFVQPALGHLFGQFLLLGATMAVLDTMYECALVVAISRLRARFRGSRTLERWQAKVSGVVLIALGVRLAVQRR